MQLTLEQIDVIRRLVDKYPNQMQLVTTAKGEAGIYKLTTSQDENQVPLKCIISHAYFICIVTIIYATNLEGMYAW